jgi:ankyrin repeat protein
LDSGAHLDIPDCQGKTALAKAREMGCIDIVRMLLEHGADANWIDSNSKSIIQLAVKDEQKEIALLLAEYGADLNYADPVSFLSLIACLCLLIEHCCIELRFKVRVD